MGEAKKRREDLRSRTSGEINKHFVKQWNALVSSCLAFDSGDDWETMRIAGAVANFCNDGTATSLLTLIDFRKSKKARFFDTAGEINGLNLLNDHPLVGMMSGAEGSKFLNFFDDLPETRWIKFGNWWDGVVVRFASDASTFTRKEVILCLRNTEGYGHIQRTVEPLVDLIGEDAPAGWQAFKNGQPDQIKGNVLASSVRQIGHELIRSIDTYGADLIKGGLEYPKHMSALGHTF